MLCRAAPNKQMKLPSRLAALAAGAAMPYVGAASAAEATVASLERKCLQFMACV